MVEPSGPAYGLCTSIDQVNTFSIQSTLNYESPMSARSRLDDKLNIESQPARRRCIYNAYPY